MAKLSDCTLTESEEIPSFNHNSGMEGSSSQRHRFLALQSLHQARSELILLRTMPQLPRAARLEAGVVVVASASIRAGS